METCLVSPDECMRLMSRGRRGGGFSRRGSPGGSFDPSKLSGIAHWYRADASDITIATGVSQWRDRIGTAHLVQATGANQPAYNASDAAYGGQPTVQSTATNMFLSVSVALARPFAIWIVGEFTTMGNVGVSFCTAGSGRPYVGNTAGNAILYTGTSLASGVSITSKRAVLATSTSAPARFIGADNWKTGGVSDAGATADGDGTMGVFAFSNGSFGSLGKVAEIIVAIPPTGAELAQMGAYFARYGITVT